MIGSRPAPPGRFKGVVLREIGPWLHRRFGVEAVRRAFESLPREWTRELDPSVTNFGALPSAWYDARIYQRVFDELLATVPEVDHVALASEAAKTVLDHTMRGIYSQLFRLLATPPAYARYVQKIWDMHYDTGSVVIEHLLPNRALHRVEGWLGHHPFACLINRQSGAIIYSRMGMPNVTIVHERCASPVCEATYAWGD